MGGCLLREKEKDEQDTQLQHTSITEDTLLDEMSDVKDIGKLKNSDILQITQIDQKCVVLRRISDNSVNLKVVEIVGNGKMMYLEIHKQLQYGIMQLRQCENYFIGAITLKDKCYLILKKVYGLAAQVSVQEIQCLGVDENLSSVIKTRYEEKFVCVGVVYIDEMAILLNAQLFKNLQLTRTTLSVQSAIKAKYMKQKDNYDMSSYQIPLIHCNHTRGQVVRSTISQGPFSELFTLSKQSEDRICLFNSIFFNQQPISNIFFQLWVVLNIMKLSDSEWGALRGQFVIVVRDEEHAQLLMKTEHQLMNCLIKNHIPVVYREDVYKMLQPIEIILDYFNQPEDSIMEHQVLCYQSLIHKSVKLKSLTKRKMPKVLRKGSCNELNKKANQDDRFLAIMNIDKKQDLPKKEEFYSFGDFTKKVDTLIDKCLADDYWFAVLVMTYEKIGLSHIDLLQETIKLHVQRKESRGRILQYIKKWLDYRYIDLVNDNGIFCTIFLQFLTLVELIEGNSQQELHHLINLILNGKMNALTQSLNAPSPTSLLRKNSFHQPKKQRNFRNLSVDIQTYQIVEANSEKFTGNIFYLNTPIDQLQKQLWIVDVEMFSQLSISTMLDQNSLIKNVEISDYFDYLLFHMIFSTVICSKEQKCQIINKFIDLFCLAKEAKHFQLVHLLFCYFTHHIVSQIMKNTYPLSPVNKQRLDELVSSEIYKSIIQIDVNDKQGIIPCLAQIQLHVYRLQDIRDKQFQIIEQKWSLLAQQIFQISHLQVLIRQLNGCYSMYKNDLICKYLRNGIKNQLQSYFNCNKQCLEIQVFKVFNQT